MKLKSVLSGVDSTAMILLSLYLLDPYNFGYLFGYLIIIYIFTRKKFFLPNLDGDFSLLLLFSITYSIFYCFDRSLGTQYILIYLLFPPGFYLIGKYFAVKARSAKELSSVLFIISFIYSLTTLISVLINIAAKGFVQIDRNIPVFWDGHIIPATNMSALLTLNMCIPALLIVNFKRSSFLPRIFSIVVFVISLICVLRLGSRTQLGITLLTILATILYLFTKQSAAKNVLMFFALFALVNIGFSYFSFDKDSDIMSAYASRMDSKEFGAATAGGRTERWEKSIINLFEEPLGWSVQDFGFSHNMWFDVARIGGFIAFILLVIYSIKSLIQIKKTLTLNKSSIGINTMFLVYGMSFFLLFMVEPIFEGYFGVFTFFCFYKGILNKYREAHLKNLRVENHSAETTH